MTQIKKYILAFIVFFFGFGVNQSFANEPSLIGLGDCNTVYDYTGLYNNNTKYLCLTFPGNDSYLTKYNYNLSLSGTFLYLANNNINRGSNTMVYVGSGYYLGYFISNRGSSSHDINTYVINTNSSGFLNTSTGYLNTYSLSISGDLPNLAGFSLYLKTGIISTFNNLCINDPNGGYRNFCYKTSDWSFSGLYIGNNATNITSVIPSTSYVLLNGDVRNSLTYISYTSYEGQSQTCYTKTFFEEIVNDYKYLSGAITLTGTQSNNAIYGYNGDNTRIVGLLNINSLSNFTYNSTGAIYDGTGQINFTDLGWSSSLDKPVLYLSSNKGINALQFLYNNGDIIIYNCSQEFYGQIINWKKGAIYDRIELDKTYKEICIGLNKTYFGSQNLYYDFGYFYNGNVNYNICIDNDGSNKVYKNGVLLCTGSGCSKFGLDYQNLGGSGVIDLVSSPTLGGTGFVNFAFNLGTAIPTTQTGNCIPMNGNNFNYINSPGGLTITVNSNYKIVSDWDISIFGANFGLWLSNTINNTIIGFLSVIFTGINTIFTLTINLLMQGFTEFIPGNYYCFMDTPVFIPVRITQTGITHTTIGINSNLDLIYIGVIIIFIISLIFKKRQ